MRYSAKFFFSITCSLHLVISTTHASVSFIPPSPDALKKSLKNFPGHKSKKKQLIAERSATPLETPMATEDLEVDLHEPTFSQGVLRTSTGGVITASGLRIQARKIEYTNRIENGIVVQKVVAEDDLMMEFSGRYFVGEKLEFDFTSKKGTLWNGRTDVDIWFVGGEKIELLEDGSYMIHEAFITTSESQDNLWEINSQSVRISSEHVLFANNIRFKFFKIPLLWLPAFRSNLKIFSDPPIKYRLVWDKGLGPRATMRYRILSWQDLSIFFRLDYRLSRGFGAAVESEYYTPDDRTVFITRSYGAHDKIVAEEKSPKRYRLQGLFSHQSMDKKTFLHLQYDKYSDLQMIDDFKNNDFVIDTQKRTRLLINHQESNVFGTLNLQPQINNFESINEQLPVVMMGIRPFSIGSSGIISENYINVGYQKYVFARSVDNMLPTTRAGRLESTNTFYRPIHLGPVICTPSIGAVGIFYTNNPYSKNAGQLTFSYGAEVITQLFKSYTKYTHSLEPYLSYQGLATPRVNNMHHYTFSMDDGLYKLNQVKLGVRNNLFNRRIEGGLPSLSIDLYTNSFIAQNRFSKTFPKAYATIAWNRPTYSVVSDNCWNFQEEVLDFCNTRADITVSEDFAFGVEYRYRSTFDFRKANHNNFILDMAQSIDALVASPLSDRRDTFLARAQLRLSPRWSVHIESIQGWHRKKDPTYSAVRTEAVTILPSNWQLKVSYMHTPDDDRFTTQIQLAK